MKKFFDESQREINKSTVKFYGRSVDIFQKVLGKFYKEHEKQKP